MAQTKKNTKWKKGESGNPLGRKKGTGNRVTKVTRETLALALQGSTAEIKTALMEVREKSAKEYIDCIVKLLPYVTPKLLAAQINDEKTNHRMVAADSYFSHRQLHLGR